MIEILTASKEHSEDAVRAGLAESRPGFRIEALELVGDEWNIRISDEGGFPFKKKDEDSDSSEKSEKPKDSEKDDDDSDDDDKKDSDSEDKGEKKDDNSSVEKLRSLVEELQQKVEEVVNNAAEVAEDADGKQQKMEEIHDSVKEHVKGEGDGEGELPKGDELAPLPEDGVGLEDIGPTPGAPAPGGPPKGGPKPPMPPAGPGAKRRPPMGAPGVSTFGRAVVANHPGVDEKGEKIELLAAALQIADDPEFAELELVGMVKNRDGSFSAKLQPRNAS
jgi:hypothetical protein